MELRASLDGERRDLRRLDLLAQGEDSIRDVDAVLVMRRLREQASEDAASQFLAGGDANSRATLVSDHGGRDVGSVDSHDRGSWLKKKMLARTARPANQTP